MTEFFTQTDINELRNNPTDYVKLEIINKIAQGYEGKELSEQETKIAGDILSLLAQDISTRIRMNISEKFCRSEDVAYSIIKQLADDIEDMVAIPVVQFSKMLTEEDLTGIVHKDKGGRQRAVARRSGLSNNLLEDIINHGNEYTVQALIESNSGVISDNASDKILDKFPKNEDLIKGLFDADKVKPERAQELLEFVSEGLGKEIAVKYDIPQTFVKTIVSSSQEKLTYKMIKEQIALSKSDTDLKETISMLRAHGNLNFNLIIKTLSGGNINFLLLSLSQLCSIASENTEKLIEEKGNQGIKGLFKKASLPENMATATKVVYRLVQKAEKDGQADISGYLAKQLERLIYNTDDDQLRYVLNIVKMP